MFSTRKPKIAIDFDGTIVENKYPDIGKPKIFAFETLKKLQEDGYLLVLWTFRYGKRLNEAIEFCESYGIEFYAVNKSYPEEEFNIEKMSRKIDADIFIDDRNIGGMLSWGEIYQTITKEKIETEKPKKGFLSKFFIK
ncbi:BT0820 family HAD-type phosphatase [Flavobacterium sp. CS20]|jgi:hydroxymethylpyrimidine pyrophosphatase-like HAD family hydrolase|uniref:BT0820 family HAD-type phosphatase n=1 Tax=Flavobacterium sp. CS20 TaxID=2775246 RepID=UPI001B3A1A71|nr:hydrolase [Flavobacterium sp. CS20]QTY27423.1 hydrolase [Flavobacterium sp. CS20]